MEIMYLSLCNWNYITTDISITLVISISFFMILLLSKSHLSRKLFYINNTVGFIYILIICNYTYVYNQIAVYNVNKNSNLVLKIWF